MPLRKRHSIKDTVVLFVTTSRHNNAVFPDYPDSLNIVEEILFRTAKDKNIIIMAYVLMPTHIHLIIGSKNGGRGVSEFMHSFKGRVRESLQGKGKFWQDGFDDVVLFSQEVFNTKLNYIHNNPIKAGLVKKPEDWEYSSCNDWMNDLSDKEIFTDFEWQD